jgi:hypothetical protein
MLVDTYPKEYNEFETGLLSITFIIFLYAIKKMCLFFWIILAYILFINKFYVWLHSNMV